MMTCTMIATAMAVAGRLWIAGVVVGALVLLRRVIVEILN